MLSKHLGEVFTSAVLITGNIKAAEAAVVDGLRSCQPGSGINLLEAAALFALERRPAFPQEDEIAEVAAFLPIELQRVLRLAPHLRPYFVLRVLAGLPRESCAAVLNTGLDQVDQGTCSALLELAEMTNKETASLPLSGHFA
jgi:hypothetical protein